jgi:transposase
MSKPYSLDLRKRVVQAVHEGLEFEEIIKIFKVSKSSIIAWIKLEKTTGSLEAKTNYQKGHSAKITDWDEFKSFVEANKHDTADEMLEKWCTLKNTKMGVDVIYRGLKKIEYTFKKKL